MFSTRITLGAAFVLLSASAHAAEPVSVAETQRAILADYQRILSSTTSDQVRSAAARLARGSYRELVRRAENVDELTADDLIALAACYESLDDPEKAVKCFQSALEKRDDASVHLSLARLLAVEDVAKAEEHFRSAAKLQPGHPELPSFHLRASRQYYRQRDWRQSAQHLERYMEYTKILADRGLADSSLQRNHRALGLQLDRVRRYAGMMNQPAPALEVDAWIQGASGELDKLRGRVLIVDFFAIWAGPSRRRIEMLKKLDSKYGKRGLEIVGVTVPYKYRYDAETDDVKPDDELSADDEKAGLTAFAKKRDIGYRVGLISRETASTYGVATLPFTVLIDQRGNVQQMFLAGDEEDEAQFEDAVRRLMGVKEKLVTGK